MVAQKGGYADVGFTKKDLYNYFDKKMRENIKDGDVAASLHYLNAKSTTDPMLFCEYAVDSSNKRLKSLFWADGTVDQTTSVLEMWLHSTQHTRRTNTSTRWLYFQVLTTTHKQ
jgi:hypothetical protein